MQGAYIDQAFDRMASIQGGKYKKK